MLGAAGALCCLAAGTALGGWLRERRMARWRMLRSLTETVSLMQLLLEQERPPLPELLHRCAACAECDVSARRLTEAAQKLERDPLCGLETAYAHACEQIPAPWERAEERAAMERLFAQLGSGTAAMRRQAAVSCLHRLKPLAEHAQTEAEHGGRLCMQLGMLLGLMAGIALW